MAGFRIDLHYGDVCCIGVRWMRNVEPEVSLDCSIRNGFLFRDSQASWNFRQRNELFALPAGDSAVLPAQLHRSAQPKLASCLIQNFLDQLARSQSRNRSAYRRAPAGERSNRIRNFVGVALANEHLLY